MLVVELNRTGFVYRSTVNGGSRHEKSEEIKVLCRRVSSRAEKKQITDGGMSIKIAHSNRVAISKRQKKKLLSAARLCYVTELGCMQAEIIRNGQKEAAMKVSIQ